MKPKQQMISDGAPEAVFLSAEERAKERAAYQPKPKEPPQLSLPDAPVPSVVVREKETETKPEEALPMISITTNTRGIPIMPSTKQNFSAMSGPELLAAYNKMAESATGKEAGAKAVSRFADTAAGIARCEKLASTIKARTDGLKASDAKKGGAKAKPAAKGATKAASPKKAATDSNQEKIAIEFEARAGTNREKLLLALQHDYKKQVPLNALLKKVYGSANVENKGALLMCIKGAEMTIKTSKLPYQIKKEKDEAKEISFGLYPNK